MKSSLILSLQGTWLRCQNGVWEVISALPKLAPNTRILSDFDNSPFGVMPVDTRPDFAAAVIEKTLRSEGLIDSEVHMLSHRLFAVGGGTRVLFTAIPLTQWQATFSWLATHTDISLLYSVDTAMLALAQKHDAVICRIGRQFRLLVSTPTTLISISVNAFSDDADDLETAIQNLTDQARMQWQPRNDKMSIFWCDLLAPGKSPDVELLKSVAKRLGVKIETAATTSFQNGDQLVHTCAEEMLSAMTWRSALNPTFEKIASFTDRYSLPIAGLTAACGIGLLAISAYWLVENKGMENRQNEIQNKISTIDARIGNMDVSPETLLLPYNSSITFLDKLHSASLSPDALEFFDDLREASKERVRIMRVRFDAKDGSFRVDGVPYNSSSERAISGFLGALQLNGYRVRSEDPGVQGQQAGFFSYSVKRNDVKTEVKS